MRGTIDAFQNNSPSLMSCIMSVGFMYLLYPARASIIGLAFLTGGTAGRFKEEEEEEERETVLDLMWCPLIMPRPKPIAKKKKAKRSLMVKELDGGGDHRGDDVFCLKEKDLELFIIVDFNLFKSWIRLRASTCRSS